MSLQDRDKNQLQSPFGFKELTSPLVCGTSCGNVAKTTTGTLGGFLVVKGNSNEEAVYAMSNHHVFVGDGDMVVHDPAVYTGLLTSLEKLRNSNRDQATGCRSTPLHSTVRLY